MTDRLDALEAQVGTMDARMDTMEKRLDAPLFTSKQLYSILAITAASLLAIGGWANSINQGMENLGVILTDTRTVLTDTRVDLKQLGEVAVLKARLESQQAEIERLRNRIEDSRYK